MADRHATAPAIAGELAEALRAHTGEWVAVELQRIVASGSSAREVYEQARAAGHTDPLVFHVSEHPERAAFF